MLLLLRLLKLITYIFLSKTVLCDPVVVTAGRHKSVYITAHVHNICGKLDYVRTCSRPPVQSPPPPNDDLDFWPYIMRLINLSQTECVAWANFMSINLPVLLCAATLSPVFD